MPRRNAKGRFVKTGASRVRRRKARARRRNPRRRASAKRRPAMGYVSGTKKIRRRKLNPRRHRRSHRRHRNPRFSVSGITSQLMPAALGAMGGIAVDLAIGYLPIPAQFTTGYYKHGLRIASALGIGYLARRFMGAKGNAVAAGAVTIAVYMLAKDLLVQFAPSVKGLGDYEEISIDNTADQIGAYMDPAYRLGAYLPDGSVAPGPVGAYMSGPIDDYYDRDGAALTGMDY